MAYIVSVSPVNRAQFLNPDVVPGWVNPLDPAGAGTLVVPYPPEWQAGDIIGCVFMYGNATCPAVTGYPEVPSKFRSGAAQGDYKMAVLRCRIAEGWEDEFSLPMAEVGDGLGFPALAFSFAIRNADTAVIGDVLPGAAGEYWWDSYSCGTPRDTVLAGNDLALNILGSAGPAEPALFLHLAGWAEIRKTTDPEYGTYGPSTMRWAGVPYDGPGKPVVLHEQINAGQPGDPLDARTGVGLWAGYTDGGNAPGATLHVAEFSPYADSDLTGFGGTTLVLKAGLCIKPTTLTGGAGTLRGIRKAGETVSLAAPGVSIGSVSYPDAYTWEAPLSGVAAPVTVTATASGGQTASQSLAPAAPPTVTQFTMPATSSSKIVALTMAALAAAGATIGGYFVSRDSTAPTAATSGWTTSPPTSYTFPTPGQQTLFGWAKDSNGAVSPGASATVTILDTSAPSNITFSLPGSASSLTVPLTFTATDDVGVTGYCAKTSSTTPAPTDGCFVPTAPTIFTFPSAGAKTLYGWARDAAGNVSVRVQASTTITLPVNACTSFTYSDWGACQPGGTQTRTVASSSPAGCTGGSPLLSQSCTYVAPAEIAFGFTDTVAPRQVVSGGEAVAYGPYVLTQTTRITALEAAVDAGSADVSVILSVYADASGSPGAWVLSAPITVKAASFSGWMRASLPAATDLPPGSYWLTWLSDTTLYTMARTGTVEETSVSATDAWANGAVDPFPASTPRTFGVPIRALGSVLDAPVVTAPSGLPIRRSSDLRALPLRRSSDGRVIPIRKSASP